MALKNLFGKLAGKVDDIADVARYADNVAESVKHGDDWIDSANVIEDWSYKLPKRNNRFVDIPDSLGKGTLYEGGVIVSPDDPMWKYGVDIDDDVVDTGNILGKASLMNSAPSTGVLNLIYDTSGGGLYGNHFSHITRPGEVKFPNRTPYLTEFLDSSDEFIDSLPITHGFDPGGWDVDHIDYDPPMDYLQQKIPYNIPPIHSGKLKPFKNTGENSLKGLIKQLRPSRYNADVTLKTFDDLPF
jgi:hypothetical protein